MDNNISEDTIEVYIKYDEIFKDIGEAGPDRVEDFDLDSAKLFIHPTGAHGLYYYDFSLQKLTLLSHYGSGNYIAFDSNYVFYEISGYAIFRYNLLKDTTDLQLDLNSFDYANILGIKVYQHILYIKLGSQNSYNSVLAKFDLEGNFIESIPYARRSFFIAIDSDIEYSIFVSNENEVKLSRFNLNTNSFLEHYMLPTENCDCIRIYEKYFYFTDFNKRFIGTLPISKIE